MEQLKVPVKKRNIDFGIITWPYALDFEAKSLFGQKDRITIEYDGKLLQNRKVSYQYRRFSIGKKRIEAAKNKEYFVITKRDGFLRKINSMP
jgi:hypothetical protein